MTEEHGLEECYRFYPPAMLLDSIITNRESDACFSNKLQLPELRAKQKCGPVPSKSLPERNQSSCIEDKFLSQLLPRCSKSNTGNIFWHLMKFGAHQSDDGTTPELAPPQTFTTTTGGCLRNAIWLALQQSHRGASPVESGFEPGTLRPWLVEQFF
ncbi:hypothetical protein AVEN_215276-1 [Araneus ventricosus]|uniref:Uncharacterized protein n=1 Tax=Araneus ventricosus TaxID=182803 RepID=A0A4Y2J6A8_ARAVE|nr:hypothetical protein AVEN_215276-1 [Araneus ventricosus]